MLKNDLSHLRLYGYIIWLPLYYSYIDAQFLLPHPPTSPLLFHLSRFHPSYFTPPTSPLPLFPSYPNLDIQSIVHTAQFLALYTAPPPGSCTEALDRGGLSILPKPAASKTREGAYIEACGLAEGANKLLI